MMPGNVSATFACNLSSSDAKALSLFLSHSFAFPSPLQAAPPTAPAAAPLLWCKVLTRMLTAIPMAIKMKVIIMPCSLNSICIFSANEMPLAIVSIIPVSGWWICPLVDRCFLAWLSGRHLASQSYSWCLLECRHRILGCLVFSRACAFPFLCIALVRSNWTFSCLHLAPELFVQAQKLVHG